MGAAAETGDSSAISDEPASSDGSHVRPEWRPFVRDDMYGEGGVLRPLPAAEKARLALMAVTLLPLRFFMAMFCVISYHVLLRLATLLPDPLLARRIARVGGRFWSRACLYALGFFSIKWVHVGPPADSQHQCVCIVSNHLGWTDILVHMSRFLPSFVARDGTQNIPLVGLISRMMDCLYVKRENKDASTQGMGAQVQQRIRHLEEHPEEEAAPMLLFPEGTTTNGKYLLPFKTGAFLAGLPVQPVIIQYGKGRISVCWESMDAPRHLFYVLCTLTHSATCHLLPVYVPSPEEVSNPKLYASNVRDYMLKYSKLSPSHATLEDKRTYQDHLRRRMVAAGYGKSS